MPPAPVKTCLAMVVDRWGYNSHTHCLAMRRTDDGLLVTDHLQRSVTLYLLGKLDIVQVYKDQRGNALFVTSIDPRGDKTLICIIPPTFTQDVQEKLSGDGKQSQAVVPETAPVTSTALAPYRAEIEVSTDVSCTSPARLRYVGDAGFDFIIAQLHCGLQALAHALGFLAHSNHRSWPRSTLLPPPPGPPQTPLEPPRSGLIYSTSRTMPVFPAPRFR